MGNTISSSFYTRSIAWLTSQTFPKRATDKDANTAIKWFARQTKATNIGISSGIIFLISLIFGHFTKDSDNKLLNSFTKGINWVSALVGILTPFANLLSDKKSDSTSGLLFDTNDTQLKEKFLKVFREDSKIPVTTSLPSIMEKSLLPQTNCSKGYREKIYKTVLELASDPKDPLFLSTTLEKTPSELKGRASELRKGLLKSYNDELSMEQTDKSQYSEEVIKIIVSILEKANEIPKYEWNEDVKKQKEIDEQNNARFVEFKQWGTNAVCPPIAETELKTIFDQFSQSQKENLPLLGKLLQEDSNSDLLREEAPNVIDIISLELEKTEGIKEPLANNLLCNIKFFILYLNKFLSKKVMYNGIVPVSLMIDEVRVKGLINNLLSIVHNQNICPEVKRDLNFFLNPEEISLPELAMCLLQDLQAPKAPTNDEFNECSKVLQIVHKCLYNSDQKVGSRVILISGNPSISAYFGRYASRKLCVPIEELEDFNIVERDGSVYIRYGSNETPINEYFRTLVSIAPIVISLNYFDCMINAKASNDQHISVQRSALFEQLKEINKSGKPIVVIIGISGGLDYEKLRNASFDNNGYSSEVGVVLKECLHSEFTSPEISPICFHGLQKKKIAEYKEQKLREKESTIKAIIKVLETERSKTVTSPLNYSEITLASKDLSIAQIASAIRDLAPRDLTQENIIKAFELVRSK